MTAAYGWPGKAAGWLRSGRGACSCSRCLLYGPLIYRFAREARGHGVPEVVIADVATYPREHQLTSRGGGVRCGSVLVQGKIYPWRI